MTINERVQKKLGFSDTPSDDQIKKWAAQVQFYIRTGEPSEKAGMLAAKDVFVGIDEYILEKSFTAETDTIQALLDLIKNQES